MKVGIVSEVSEVLESELKSIIRELNKLHIEYVLSFSISEDIEKKDVKISEIDADYIIIIGGDRLILRTLLDLRDRETPIVSLSGRRSTGFLSITGVENLPIILRELIRGNYTVEDRIRLEADLDGKYTSSALNEFSIFNRSSGMIIRYSLYINNDFIWRDTADGVIISTPTGSTAYALSAGGPIVKDGDMIVIVPVNTLNPMHKPIVTSSKSTILLTDLEPNKDILIMDGQIRKVIPSRELVIKRSKFNAKFVKINYAEIYDIEKKLSNRLLSKKVRMHLTNLPPSAKLVFKTLEYEGSLTTKELIEKTGLSPRTLSYALKKLLDGKIIIRRFHDRDARIQVYSINVGDRD